jgi:hypothetical protein
VSGSLGLPPIWPIGAERIELDDGEFVRAGDFDERDAVVARRTFPATVCELLDR